VPRRTNPVRYVLAGGQPVMLGLLLGLFADFVLLVVGGLNFLASQLHSSVLRISRCRSSGVCACDSDTQKSGNTDTGGERGHAQHAFDVHFFNSIQFQNVPAFALTFDNLIAITGDLLSIAYELAASILSE
jgi:hypothetical protein